MKRSELLTSKEYWLVNIQQKLYDEIKRFMMENKLSRKDLAEHLGVSKGYVSQLLNGDFDHKISKLADLAVKIGKAPMVDFQDLLDVINKEKEQEFKTSINSPDETYSVEIQSVSPRLKGMQEYIKYHREAEQATKVVGRFKVNDSIIFTTEPQDSIYN